MGDKKCSVRMCRKSANQNTVIPLANGAVAIVPLCWTHAKEHKDEQ